MQLSLDLITGVIAFVFTLMVFSYVLSDNPVFRVALHIFIGVSAGYAAAVVWHQVLLPRLVEPMLNGSLAERLLLVIPVLLGLSLLFKISQRAAPIGSPAMAFLVGTGAAVVLTGALNGTLFPQFAAAVGQFDMSRSPDLGSMAEQFSYALVALVGTIVTLVYFQFGVRDKSETQTTGRRNALMRILAYLGQIFVAITFGALFAGVFTATLTALIERTDFIINLFTGF
ncbi:MAG: hypothetical protein AB1846_09735 [Chloroflexota bacterium]